MPVRMVKLDDDGVVAPRLGRQPGGKGLGPGGKCVCPNPKCKHEIVHKRGAPCYKLKCPKCGTAMTRPGKKVPINP